MSGMKLDTNFSDFDTKSLWRRTQSASGFAEGRA